MDLTNSFEKWLKVRNKFLSEAVWENSVFFSRVFLEWYSPTNLTQDTNAKAAEIYLSNLISRIRIRTTDTSLWDHKGFRFSSLIPLFEYH